MLTQNKLRDECDQIKLLAVADWKAIEHYLGLRASSAPGGKPGTCFLCDFKKGAEPATNGEEFRLRQTTNDLKTAYHDSHFPLGALRYDPMHGIARVLCFLFSSLIRQLDPRRATSFRVLLSEALPSHRSSSNDDLLDKISPNEAGRILEHDALLLRLADEVSDSSFSVPLALNQGISIQQTSQPEAFLRLMISMRNYRRFTRLRSYNRHNILAFDKSWQYIRAIVCINGWCVTPTAHYMFHHYLEKVLVDAEASFFVLQEGGEHAMGDTSDITYFCQNNSNRTRELLKHAIAISKLHLASTPEDFWTDEQDYTSLELEEQNFEVIPTQYAQTALKKLILPNASKCSLVLPRYFIP